MRSSRRAICVLAGVLASVSATVLGGIAVSLYLAYDIMTWVGPGDGVTVDVEIPVRVWEIGIAAALLLLVSLVVACWSCGRRDASGGIVLCRFDRIFTELHIAAIAAVAVFGGAGAFLVDFDTLVRMTWFREICDVLAVDALDVYYEPSAWFLRVGPDWLEPLGAVMLSLAVSGLLVTLLLSVVRKLKAHMFWRTTLVGSAVLRLYAAGQATEHVGVKVMAVLIGGCLLSATWIGTVIVLVLILVFVPKWLRTYDEIRTGVRRVKDGELDYKIPITDKGELDRLAMDINEISAATAVAVQNELKNQRMKTDLITNVSHDLKTPLTSMVTYVDLLKTEGLDSADAPQYLEILEEKTQRLQKLTEDLFEAAKASSGAIPVQAERIEMTAAVNQALAEMEERLDANALEVIFTNRTQTACVMADGQLLWRIIENLLVNVAKYALPGSRVYLDLTVQEESAVRYVVLEVKNISRDPLNISAEDLMERFQRGDASRNTEGSGLGLAIARDLARLMSGTFQITVDGDLFKATLRLPEVGPAL